MKSVILATALFASLHAFPQAPTFAFAKQFGGVNPGNGDDAAVSVVYGTDGSIYVAGSFFGLFDMDPGSTTASVSSAGDRDIYVVKLNSLGDFIWGKRVGGNGTDQPREMVVASNGDLIITGRFVGVVDFNPNAGTLNLGVGATDQNGFVWRLSAQGNTVWAKFWRGGGFGESVDIAADGSIYVAGNFTGTINGSATNELNLNMTSLGNRDACFFKLTSNGALLWAGRVGGAPGNDYANVIRAASDGVVIAGDFSPGGFGSVVDFNPGPGTVNRQGIGNSDPFVLKLDEDGNYMWVDIIGSIQPDRLSGMDIDGDGSIWITGPFRETMDANPGAGTNNIVAAGMDDGFVVKLSATGGYLWSGRIGGTMTDIPSALQVGADGGVYVSGNFYGTADFDPGAGTTNLTSAGTNDGFIAKLQSDGSFAWARRVGGADSDLMAGIAVTSTGGVCVAGAFHGAVDMDPDAGVSMFNTLDPADADGFLLKLEQCEHQFSDAFVTACGSYSLGGQTFTESGDYIVDLISSTNCDSTVFLALTIESGTATSTTSASACDSYAWNGSTYTQSGTYTASLTTAAGCDSIATLQLTISQSNSSTTNASACDSYTWNGNTYTASGSYQVVLTNAVGCDSTATLQLNISTVNTALQQDGATLTAAQNNAAYQWVDCNNGFAPFFGQTGQSFTPAQNGNYAVEITFGICSTMSDCVEVLTTGIGESELNALRVYPNPAAHQLTLEGTPAGDTIELMDAAGRLVRSLRAAEGITMVDLFGIESGAYTIRIAGPRGKRNARIVVQ